MKEILQFSPGDLNTTMAWYLTGRVTMRQLCDELNAKLRDKAERLREQEELNIPGRCRPNCF